MSRHPPQPAMRFMGLRFDLDEVFGEATIRGPDLEVFGNVSECIYFHHNGDVLGVKIDRYVFDARVDPYARHHRRSGVLNPVVGGQGARLSGQARR